jgi:hypothetical protein
MIGKEEAIEKKIRQMDRWKRTYRLSRVIRTADEVERRG